jgi:hypothetical protein
LSAPGDGRLPGAPDHAIGVHPNAPACYFFAAGFRAGARAAGFAGLASLGAAGVVDTVAGCTGDSEGSGTGAAGGGGGA